MGMFLYSTSALNYFVAEVLESARTLKYACGSALLALRIFLQKRIYKHSHPIKWMLAIVVLLTLSGCGGWNGYHAVSLDMTPPDGPEIYKQAWLDGCKTGVAANTNDFYKIFARIKQDPEGMKQEIYRRVWQDAYNYCWFHTSTGLTQPI